VLRKPLVALCVLSVCLIAEAQTTVTVVQLEATLAAAHSKSDKELAQEISKLALKQRLTSARLSLLQADLPGDKSRQALLAIADESAFLELPAAEILPTAPPNRAAVKAILSRAVDFVETTVPKMPNFFATRETTRLQSLKAARDVALDSSDGLPGSFENQALRTEPFHLIDTARAIVLYRDGKEEVEAPQERKKSAKVDGLTNWGQFGPLLAVVMSDILAGKIGWLHWEHANEGPLAVFRYKIEKEKSHYTVDYCCVPSSDPKKGEFKTVPPYHGEISIDTKTGAVLRFTLETELDSKLPIKRAYVAMEYGPVQIGGASYICPIKSISLSHAVSFSFTPASIVPASPRYTRGIRVMNPPETTAINDTAFTSYHMYRADIRIVPDSPDEPAPKITPPSIPASPPNP
jgi:hypothetical protein